MAGAPISLNRNAQIYELHKELAIRSARKTFSISLCTLIRNTKQVGLTSCFVLSWITFWMKLKPETCPG